MKVIKFSAAWCQPCKVVSGILEQIENKPLIEEVDIDEHFQLAALHQVRGVPTLIKLDDNGHEIGRIVGVQPKSKFEQWLDVQQ